MSESIPHPSARLKDTDAAVVMCGADDGACQGTIGHLTADAVNQFIPHNGCIRRDDGTIGMTSRARKKMIGGRQPRHRRPPDPRKMVFEPHTLRAVNLILKPTLVECPICGTMNEVDPAQLYGEFWLRIT